MQNSKLYQAAIVIVDRLQKAGYTTLFAGGAVRDMLHQWEGNNDIDIATVATPAEIEKMHNIRDFDVLDLDQPNYRKKLNKEIKRMRDSIKHTKESIQDLVRLGKCNDSYQEYQEEKFNEMRNR